MAQRKGKNKDGTPSNKPAPKGKKYRWRHTIRRFRKYISLSVIVGVILTVIGLTADLSGISSSKLWKFFFPEKMTGDFRVAVADFAIIGKSVEASEGTELAEGVYLKLNESLSEINKDFTVTVWSPDKVGKVKGDSPEERAESAEKIAKRIDADLIIYGVIDMSEPVWKITPEFYVDSESFSEAEEITGQYQLGGTFSLVGQESIARRVEFNDKFEVLWESP